MKTITVRLPDSMAADLQAQSHARRVSLSDLVRERLQHVGEPRSSSLDAIADLVGSVDALAEDLSAHKKHYLRATGYGRKRHR